MFNKEIKFSLWCDFLERDFINAKLSELITNGSINGATSNPSIFKTAICESQAYNDMKEKYKKYSPKDLYEILATSDIRLAASKLMKNFSNDDDGFISLEVDPNLYNSSKKTYKEAARLFDTIKMSNVMMKVPATKSGYKAMKALIRDGINVNATLIFSQSQADKCLKAFKEGSKLFQKRFPNSPLPKAVISIFVSRFDRLLNDKLKSHGIEANKYGIYNATLIYQAIQKENLPNVRALFASTGVKGDELVADYYIKELYYPNSVNTAPLATIEAFTKNKPNPKQIIDSTEIKEFFIATKKAGIKHSKVCDKLLNDGLKAFCDSFNEILEVLK